MIACLACWWRRIKPPNYGIKIRYCILTTLHAPASFHLGNSDITTQLCRLHLTSLRIAGLMCKNILGSLFLKMTCHMIHMPSQMLFDCLFFCFRPPSITFLSDSFFWLKVSSQEVALGRASSFPEHALNLGWERIRDQKIAELQLDVEVPGWFMLVLHSLCSTLHILAPVSHPSFAACLASLPPQEMHMGYLNDFRATVDCLFSCMLLRRVYVLPCFRACLSRNSLRALATWGPKWAEGLPGYLLGSWEYMQTLSARGLWWIVISCFQNCCWMILLLCKLWFRELIRLELEGLVVQSHWCFQVRDRWMAQDLKSWFVGPPSRLSRLG